VKKKLSSLFLSVALSLVVSSGLFAKDKTQGHMSKMDKSKITGCLQNGPDPNTFVLIPSDSSAGTSQMGSNQTGGTPEEMARSENSYTLIPDQKVNLSDHVGHQVQVEGEFIGQQDTTNSSTTNPSASSQNQQQFKVSSIRKIGTTCKQ
jgi:hypothetical protein